MEIKNKEIDKYVNNIKGENKYKIETEKKFQRFIDNINITPVKIRYEKQYINFIFKLWNINNSVDSYSQIIKEIKNLSKEDDYFNSMKIFDNIKTTSEHKSLSKIYEKYKNWESPDFYRLYTYHRKNVL